MKIQLSDHFTCSKLLRYTLPSIVMMVFTSIYGVVDGFFVSNFVGKTPFTAVNFIMPVLMILGAAGFMLGTGGGALIAKTMGEGKREEANRLFSLVIYVGIGCGAVLAALGLFFIRPIAAAMFAAARLLGKPLSLLFVGYDQELLEMTIHAFSIFSFSFLFSGLAIFGSSFFTALNNGLVSAVISFLRTLVFQVSAVIIFPMIWDVDGIWMSIAAAEVMAVAVTAAFLWGMRKKYQY